MKTLGLVGGTSWVSTVDYYKYLNEEINSRLGGNEVAKCIIHSFNYGEIQRLTSKQDWDTLLELVSGAAHGLCNAGAEGIVLCANTMHLVADRLRNASTSRSFTSSKRKRPRSNGRGSTW